MKRGSLVALEGLDGAGKSTQLARLAEAIRAAGHEVVTTREPTDGAWGRRVREAARSGAKPAPEEELAWFMADRREHVAACIAPALEAGHVVLTDRYYLSTVAYQGARGLDWRAILAESEAAFPKPDLALVLDVDPAAGLERVHARGRGVDPLFEDLAFLRRVATLFAAIELPYVAHVNGAAAADAVHAAILDVVRARLGLV